tara:strand:+ start:27 stop:404 length:378 start_codon:yes stop_codon:yes gene_type:complete
MTGMISLQLKYSAQSFLTGDCVAIREAGFQYFEGDCLSAWLAAGRSAESWRKAFGIIFISDCNDINHPDIVKLLLPYSEEEDPEFQRKYFIQIPSDFNNIHRVNIRELGETTATLVEIIALTAER